MAATVHRVRQRPALRALGLAAVLVVFGGLMVLLADRLNGLLVLAIAGWVVIILGLVLLVAARGLARAMLVEVVLDEIGYQLRGPLGSKIGGSWAEISRVTRGKGRMTLHRQDGSKLHLVVAGGGTTDLDSLGADLSGRLDADRGYR